MDPIGAETEERRRGRATCLNGNSFIHPRGNRCDLIGNRSTGLASTSLHCLHLEITEPKHIVEVAQ